MQTAKSQDFPAQITPEFNVSVERVPQRWSVKCEGVLDVEQAAAVLQPRLLALHQEAIAEKVPVVEVSLDKLEYINSSGLKSFMVWFLAAANAKESQYAIRVYFDPERGWQHTSFRPMERLAPTTVKLVPIGNAHSQDW